MGAIGCLFIEQPAIDKKLLFRRSPLLNAARVNDTFHGIERLCVTQGWALGGQVKGSRLAEPYLSSRRAHAIKALRTVRRHIRELIVAG